MTVIPLLFGLIFVAAGALLAIHGFRLLQRTRARVARSRAHDAEIVRVDTAVIATT